MAYAALVSLEKDLDSILVHRSCTLCFLSRFCGSDCLLLEKKQGIQRLHENIVFLINFLVDFPREAGELEARVTNTANQAKDIFHNLQHLDWTSCFESQNVGGIEAYTSSEVVVGIKVGRCSKVLTHHNWERFCQELENVIVETDLIREEGIHIKKSKKHPKSSRLAADGNDIVVGIEEDLSKIMSRLCGEPSELQIIPIVGMGGIGKTTLARYAYDGPLSVDRFDVRVWVTISQSYDLMEILDSILRSIKINVSREEYWFSSEELLKEDVYKYLKWRRYLIVMDDMWDTNVWDDVRMAFPDDCNGSRIMITTRNLDIASYVDTWSQPHEMRQMAVDRSWSLLRAKVFGNEDCPLELEKIGEVIAEKCKGLPLAIVVIAGVLSKLIQMKDSWEKIARNVSKAVNTSDDQQFTDILSLSYMHLPLHLRLCFLYIGCFPEDHEINALELIRLWAAEGFLISNESKDMEELGYEYLEDLGKRSLVFFNKKRYDGKIRTVKIHDLLRDLCLRKSREENFLCTINEFSGSFPQGIENSNRLSIFCNISGLIPNMESSPTHTILLFNHWAFDSWKSFRLLRVVHALSVTFTSSTSSSNSNSIRYIGELIHLRYLALTCEATKMTLRLVSESLYQLQNLQTLIVKVSIGVRFQRMSMSFLDDEDLDQRYMKFEMWRMPQLRHLILLGGFLPDPSTDSFQEISSLSNLHTLSRIQDFKCSERILEMIPNLKKLGIIYSYQGTYETGWSSYSLNNLVHLHKLEKLSLYAEPYPNMKNDVLSENISFPVTLKKLTLSGCRFPWEDMTMIGSLPNLEVLKLMRRACHGTEWETSEGEFCQLKVLLIDSTDLHQWISDSSCFPRLERLTLYECESLREVLNGIGDIPTLQFIEVDVQNLSIVESAKCIEEEQQSFGNDLLQVHFLKSRSWANFTE